MKLLYKNHLLFLIFVIAAGYAGSKIAAISDANAAQTTPMREDVRNTKHNLSFPENTEPDPARNVRAAETASSVGKNREICVFCHTPHGSNSDALGIKPPLWNRFLSEASYQMYDQVWSFSFEGEPNSPGMPTGYSRLCLSCHDGTIALGTTLNAPGPGGRNSNIVNPENQINMECATCTGETAETITMPPGSGAATGDTRRLGTDLRNDHPVSFTFDDELAVEDEELVSPGFPATSTKYGEEPVITPLKRFPGNSTSSADSVQCTSCHNPHNTAYPKFLRASLWQNDPPGEQIICLFCHDKPGWQSPKGGELNTHALSTAVHAEYPSVANPYDYDGQHSVAEYACRNCHDPHTVAGSKRLHREGIDMDGNDTAEATCYLCHSPNTGNASVELIAGSLPDPLFKSGDPAPDIYSQFAKDVNKGLGGSGSAMNLSYGTGHQPVFTPKSQEGIELNSPDPPAGNEEAFGLSQPEEAHIECVDCHNPHQVTGPKFSLSPNRMKGMKGVDIDGNVVGHSVPGNDREVYIYEVCFRCHGDSYSNIFAGNTYPQDVQYRSTPIDADLPDAGTIRDTILNNFGPPPAPTNPNLSFPGFSNKRRELNPDSVPTARGLETLSYNTAFHPVAGKGMNQSNALNNAFDPRSGLGVDKTIMCTDCHNTSDIGDVKGPVTTSRPGFSDANRNDILRNDDVIDNSTGAVGPHGSDNIRILRAEYTTRSSSDCNGNSSDDCRYNAPDGPQNGVTRPPLTYQGDLELCLRCHDRRVFIEGTSDNTNFYGRYTNRTIDTKFNYLGDSSPNALWYGNLHYLHINFGDAKCHDCHNNVHSNLEAPNTIYGNHNGDCIKPASELFPPGGCDAGSLPPVNNAQDDGLTCENDECDKTSTHLVNFNPVSVTGNQSTLPRWFYGISKWEEEASVASSAYMVCDLRCHGRTMNECAYQYESAAGSLSFEFCVK